MTSDVLQADFWTIIGKADPPIGPLFTITYGLGISHSFSGLEGVTSELSTCRELSRCGPCVKVTKCRGSAPKHAIFQDITVRFVRVIFSLKRPQEINDLLLLLSAQLIEMFDDLISLAPLAPVISNSLYHVVGPSVMEEENALSDAPQGSGSELVGAGAALRDAVGEAFAHVVDKKVRVEIRGLIGNWVVIRVTARPFTTR